ncbi:cell wall-active antibiotics response protein LiaF [Paenibacillus sp. IITD108]|uniref:cell wall-active antibiotics response protein LiaF n=1 Tax=Paenibacillus sp. IITD108 TaxID=3116649 RepID=UPI002F41FDF4
MKGNVLSRIFTGLVIIGIGVVFLMQQTGYITLSIGEIISTFWPVILITIGLKQVFAQECNGGGWWGIFMVAIGVVFLGRNLEWFDWSVGDIIRYLIPVIIIGVGLRMMLRPKATQQKPEQDEWQYYRPYTDQQEDVPPAPPLHPDPTKPVEPDSKEMKNGYTSEQDDYIRSGAAYDNNKHYHDPHANAAGDFEDGFNKESFKKYKAQFKQYRRDYKRDKHNHHNHHDGWWDYSSKSENRSSFIGDIHIGHEYWELKPMNISHFIGDTVLDLTKANVPSTETRINISSFIGDVKVYVPNDYEIAVQVVSSAFIGDVKILGRREGGIFTNVNIESPLYREAEKKIKIVVSTFIGDVRVTKVG